ncbi:hypothetical protein C4K68_10235 [Pokkaliibacter plantistimulans]|uniref:Surface lipoprotein assembly modifier C-terminal domain-containing protein n=1 Tax=Proteobacteria bacterium 228 TaxID=2083153 RepID=A0A2S5KS17_9PROT|nr:surface lipoprotein assembly modifier [Pokkaliibacter plantistimulans]PPC77462.1 hypothetical protein C4K68_10235 [Pokkaliibacter plantistimulans]
MKRFYLSASGPRRLLLGLGLMGLLPWQSGQAADPLDALRSLLAHGNTTQAWFVARQFRGEWEGDPQFDQLYAQAALASGQTGEALFALERAQQTTDSAEVHWLLAQTYLAMEQQDPAKNELYLVLNRHPSPGLAAEARKRLRELGIGGRQEGLQGYVEAFIGHDSNATQGPYQQPSLAVINASDLEESDGYFGLAAGGRYDHPLSDSQTLFADGRAENLSYFDRTDQDTFKLNLNLGSRWDYERQHWKVTLQSGHERLDGDNALTRVGVTGEWGFQSTAQLRLGTFVGVHDLNYELDDRDSVQWLGGVNLVFSGPTEQSATWFAGTYYGQDEADNDSEEAHNNTDRRFIGAQAGVVVPLLEQLDTVVSVNYLNSRYDGTNSIYNERREDDYSAFNIDLRWHFNKAWSWTGGYRLIRNDSNIEYYDYTRHLIQTGVRYDFR